MAGKKKKKIDSGKIMIAQNRKARRDYAIIEEVEAGIQLVGSEVKSLRTAKANIQDAYAYIKNEEAYLTNCYIAEFSGANRFNHAPKRERKLLLHKKEIKRLMGKLDQKGLTLLALSIYFNKKGLVKVQLALGKGQSNYDKRQVEKDRDWQRKKSRVMKEG